MSRRSPTTSRASFGQLVRPIGGRQIGRYRIGAAAGFAYLGDDAVGFVGAAAVVHQNLRTGRGEREGAGAADAAGGAGHEGGFARQIRHDHPPCCCCGERIPRPFLDGVNTVGIESDVVLDRGDRAVRRFIGPDSVDRTLSPRGML